MLSRGRLVWVSGAAIAVVSAVLHAQDWIEVELSENTYTEQDRAMQRDSIDIPIRPNGELEYKLGMEEGDSIVYSWTVEGIDNPELLYAEFHGHTETQPGQPGTVMLYRKAEGGAESGTLTAPFSGIHGWYLQNRSARAIVVKLEVAGFYEIVEQ